ncbi:MAG: hypothetical protein ABSE84_15305 [Isosphaeraceae bacterium]
MINANGSPATLKGKPIVMLTPGSRYANGFVTVSDVYARDVLRTNAPSEDVDMTESMRVDMEPVSEVLRATLTADVAIPGAYAVLIAYPVVPSSDVPQPLAVVLHSLGDLKAGIRTDLSVVLPKLGQSDEQGWSILVFSGSRQVRCTGMDRILPGYFDRIEAFKLRKLISQQIAKGADERIAVYREMPLGLPGPILAKYHSKTIDVEIAVGADGRVVRAAPVGVNDEDLTSALMDGFSSWLFLPSMRHGVPEPGSVILPLKL